MTVEAELADGRILEFPDGTDPQVVQSTVKKMLAPRVPETMGTKAGQAVADTAATMASGSFAAPVAGLAGIVGGVLQGPQGQSADWVRKVQDALTIKPQTRGGEILTDVATKPFQWLGRAADVAGQKTADVTGSPAAGAAVNTTIQMAPAIASALFGNKARTGLENTAEDRNILQSQQSVKDASLNEGRSAGYVVPPENSILRGVAGKSALRQEAIVRNQEVTNSLARKAVELPDQSPITPGILESQREKFAAPYREIAALAEDHPLLQPPFKNAADTLRDLRTARADATKWYQFADRSGHPIALKRAEGYATKADLLENSLEQTATALGKPELVQAMREARQKIAKTYDVERALNKGDGNIDAHVIGNMFDNNKPLSGELATIGKFDQAFRRYTTESSRIESPGGTSLPVHSSALGAAVGGGAGWFPAGVALAGGPTRSLLLSDFYQTPKTYGPSLMEQLASGYFNESAPVGLGALLAGQQKR